MNTRATNTFEDATAAREPIGPDEELVAGRYRLVRKIARGGMGEVFVAHDLSTGRPVALKRMLLDSQRSLRVNFMREYHALSELRHPRIIEVFDYGLERDAPFYTMELLDGQDLSELSPLPYREACRYLRDVASSLALLHARRLLHRDVSPRNVRRTSDGRCKLLDFGAMIPFGVPPNVTGTPPCIAPEALSGAPLDQRSDLFSLGALAYYTLTGRHAFAVRQLGALPEVWRKPPPRPQRIARDVPDALDALVMALLSLDPMKRPANAAEVIDRLSAVGELAPDDGAAVARSFLASPQLVGRNVECAQLTNRLNQTLAGQGSAVIVSGPPGVGLSRMLAEAALIAQTCGLTVVRAVARRQRGASSALLRDLLSGLLQAAPLEAERASASRPLVLAELSRAETSHAGADDGEVRASLLSQISEVFCEVAGERPLLVTVDDLERADELSTALVAALAHQTHQRSLSLVASEHVREQAGSLASVRGLAHTIHLRPLDRTQTTRLVASLFGDVPNVERVSESLFRVAAGNPKLTFELAEHLLGRGVLRYVDGTWVLPAELEEAIPQGLSEAMMSRLENVSATARELAEILCVRRGGASAERFLALARQPDDKVFRALEELVSAGVLESAGDEYVFAQDTLRKALERQLDPRRSRELHGRWAEHLLAAREPDRDTRLEAGWHLVHTDGELRGADLLAEVGPELVEQRVGMAAAVPAMERALQIYERHDRPLAKRMRLRALLSLCAYLFDYRLADRYAESTLDALYPFTGLATVERLSRWLGKSAAFWLGISWTALRWCLRFGPQRGPSVIEAIKYYARATMGLLGLRALAVDTVGTRAALERLRTFEGLPLPTLSILHTIARGITLHGEGRGAEVHASMQQVEVRLTAPGFLFGISPQERNDLHIGLLLARGINECQREHSKALECAERLERYGTSYARAAAMRVAMTYYVMRCDRERAAHYRRQLDLNAIQSGTHWQVEWIAVPVEGMAGMSWTDIVALRSCLDRLERLAAEAPSFATMGEGLRIAYHFRREDYARAAALGEAYLLHHAPFSQIGWPSIYAMAALSQVELGKPERALEICERGLAAVTEADRVHVVMYALLDAAYATTLAVLGRRAESDAVFDARLSRLRASGEYMRAFVMHEYRIKVAHVLGDKAALVQALADMREAALASRSPSVIALTDRLCEQRGRALSSPLPPAGVEPEPARSTAETRTLAGRRGSDEETAVTIFLRNAKSPELRAYDVLHMLGQYTASAEGYLFWVEARALKLAASLDETDPPESLESQLTSMLAAGSNRGEWVELALPQPARYRIIHLDAGPGVERAAVAALREPDDGAREIPRSLLAEISRALNEAPAA